MDTLAAEATQLIAPGTRLALGSTAAEAVSQSATTGLMAEILAPINTVGALFSTGWSWVKNHKREVAGGALITTAVAGYLVYRKVQPMMSASNTHTQQHPLQTRVTAADLLSVSCVPRAVLNSAPSSLSWNNSQASSTHRANRSRNTPCQSTRHSRRHARGLIASGIH